MCRILGDARLTGLLTLAGVGGPLPPPPPKPDIFAGSWDSSADVGDGTGLQGFLGSLAAAGQRQSHQNPPAQDCLACGRWPEVRGYRCFLVDV